MAIKQKRSNNIDPRDDGNQPMYSTLTSVPLSGMEFNENRSDIDNQSIGFFDMDSCNEGISLIKLQKLGTDENQLTGNKPDTEPSTSYARSYARNDVEDSEFSDKENSSYRPSNSDVEESSESENESLANRETRTVNNDSNIDLNSEQDKDSVQSKNNNYV